MGIGLIVWLVAWLVGQGVVGCLVDWLFGCFDRLSGWLIDYVVGWVVDWRLGCLVVLFWGCLVVCLVDCSVVV